VKLKEYKSNDELIEIMKSRNIKISDHEIEKTYEYLDKYSYNMFVNPYKIIHCSSYHIEKGHVYDDEVSIQSYIYFLDEQYRHDLIIFKALKEFENILSTLLLKEVLKNPSEVDRHIKGTIECQNVIKEKLLEVDNNQRHLALGVLCKSYNITKDKYYSAQNLEKYIGENNFDCYSLFHGSHRLHFKQKYEILNLLPESHFIFKELQNKFGYKKIKKHSDFNAVNALRNSICHFNSIAYKIYEEEKESLKNNKKNKRSIYLKAIKLLMLDDQHDFYIGIEKKFKNKVDMNS
jgi:hypothetical protein